jgi:hypothetical protein
VEGPAILAQTLVEIRSFGPTGYRAQYHQQSDHHSKVVSWAVMFDVLLESSLIRAHIAAGKVVAGVNHTMSDFTTSRKKKLDLVIARPRGGGAPLGRTFAQLADTYQIRLTPTQQTLLDGLPELREGAVGSVLVALEAKAAMTAHTKAKPRLYDELNSSHATVHGAADQAVAAAAVMVNHGPDFLTFDRNRLGIDTPPPLRYQVHNQPADAAGVVAKLEELPRRSGTGSFGFDAVGIILLDIRNDGSPVTIVSAPPAPQPASDFHYDQMVRRIVAHYNFRFGAI